MKNTILFAWLLLCCSLSAQQPQIVITKGFLSEKYQIGENEANPKQVRLHLEKYNAKAYYQWRKSEGALIAGTVLAITGAAGAIMAGAVGSDNPGLAAAGYLGAAACWTGTLVCALSSSARRKKAVALYNKG